MEQLINEMPASDMLALFVGKFNDFVGDYDSLSEEREQLIQELEALRQSQGEFSVLKSQLDGYKRQVTEQQLQLDVATETVKSCQGKIKELEKQLSDEQKAHVKTKSELLAISRDKSRLDNELGHLREMNPQRLKKQNVRLSEQNESQGLRIKQLEREASEYRHEIKSLKTDVQNAIDKIKFERANGKLNSAVGIYHDGDHHLVTWPQLVSMKLTDGSEFKQKPLLYVHQSGVSSMLTINPDERELQISKAPKGGLRPPKALIEKATQWLYDVNIIRNGVMQESDFMEL